MTLSVEMKAKMDELRMRVQLRTQADDELVAIGTRNQQEEIEKHKLSVATLASASQAAPAMEPELMAAIKAFVEAQNSELNDELSELFGNNYRVRNFCRATGIALAETMASHEARRYVQLTKFRRFVIIWLDHSHISSQAMQRHAIHSYAQAMRAAIGRMRSAIRKSESKRVFRTFGVSVTEMQPIAECPGLWRVTLDSRPDLAKDVMKQLLSASAADGLMLETEESVLQPSLLEQRLALARRGIKDEF